VFHYVPLHTAPVGEQMGYRAGMLPVTEYCADRVLRLPLYAGLQDDEVDRIADAVRRFYGG
jgi:dTDP-4-amino-4,6-dideoxygalactose transaminase